MKISKTWLNMLREAIASKSERSIVIWLKRTIKEFENLDRDDIAIIDDVVGTLKASYGWETSEESSKILVKDNKFINLTKISFK